MFTKPIYRQLVDLALIATLVIGSSITAFESAFARPHQQTDDNTITHLYMPISLAGSNVGSVNTQVDADEEEHDEEDHSESDGPEEVDESALMASAYSSLEPYVIEKADGTVQVREGAFEALVAETGIDAIVFGEIIALMDETNAEIQAIDEDELRALGNLGCIYNFPTLRRGNRGWWVWRLQTWLNQNHGQTLVADSIFGGNTERAVRNVQQYWRNKGQKACYRTIAVDGIVGPQGWTIARNTKSIAGPPQNPSPPSSNGYRLPQLGHTTGLCAYGYQHKRYGKNSAMTHLENVGKRYKNRGEGRISVGNISLNGGGYMAPHSSHQVGLDIDLRPMHANNGQCNGAMQWNWPNYDRDATRQLIKDLRATGRIKLILFNDPHLRNEGLSTYYPGHDNHLHVRFCEPGHSNSRYRC